ncbi:MAG: ATP-binding protein [Muribaculaceae bacterium]|nr:ATP-binding protein [Muribaculaceae bacterium]
MKFKTLHVENFGPVKDATVELRAINMFIGEQSIGKSTLAKLITIFTDYISLCKIIHRGMDSWNAQLKDYFLDIYKDDPYHISYEMWEDDKKIHIEIEPAQVSFYMMQGDKKTTNADDLMSQLIDLKEIYHVDEVVQASKNMETKSFLDLFTNSLYIPAERIIYPVLTNILPALALANSTIPKNLLRFMVDLGNAKSEYPQFDISLLGVAFKHDAAEDSIVIEEENNKKVIPITAASSGIQSLVPLMLVLHYAITKREYSSFVIEEPECNLFPTKQVELLKEILKTVKHQKRILTITTHSPYLLSAMNNILFAGMLVEKFGDGIKKYVDEIMPEEYQLKAGDCSVYSLGEDINDGVYCRSLMDELTGMIDFNSLDGVSEELNFEFEALQRTIAEYKRNK